MITRTVQPNEVVYDLNGVPHIVTCNCAGNPVLFTARYVNANPHLYFHTEPPHENS